MLPICSANEDKLLKLLGLSHAERAVIEGLQARRATLAGVPDTSEEQQVAQAVFRLSTNPPPEVGIVQRRTLRCLLRPLYAAETRIVAVGFPQVESNDWCSDPCVTVP